MNSRGRNVDVGCIVTIRTRGTLSQLQGDIGNTMPEVYVPLLAQAICRFEITSSWQWRNLKLSTVVILPEILGSVRSPCVVDQFPSWVRP